MYNQVISFSHDGEELAPVTFCTGDGCFEKDFMYEASDEQIEALKAISETCYQKINIFFICNLEIT